MPAALHAVFQERRNFWIGRPRQWNTWGQSFELFLSQSATNSRWRRNTSSTRGWYLKGKIRGSRVFEVLSQTVRAFQSTSDQLSPSASDVRQPVRYRNSIR